MDLAKQAFSCNDYELATEIFDHLLQLHGPNMDWLIGRGDAYARCGHMNEALADYMHAFRLGEIPPHRLNELVNALVAAVAKKGNLASSLEKHRSKLKEQPGDPFSCPICQGLLYEPTTLPCGRTLCRDCLRNSLEPRACVKCKVEHKQLINSRGIRNDIVLGGLLEKYFPEETKARQLRAQGNKLYARGNLQDAVGKYTEALELVPHDHYVLSNRSHAYMGLQRFEDALADAEDVCELKPDWPKGYYRKGVALVELEREDEAMVAFLQSLTLDPYTSSARKCLEKVLYNLLSPLQPATIKHLELQQSFLRTLRPGAPSSPRRLSREISDLAEEVALGIKVINHPPTDKDAEETEKSIFEVEADNPTSQAIGSELPKETVECNKKDSCSKDGKVASTSETAASSKPAQDLLKGSPHHEKPKAAAAVDSTATEDVLVPCKRKRCLSNSETLLSPVQRVEFKFPRVDVLKKPRKVPPEKLDKDDYECSLCFRLFLEPLTTPCGHTFCKLCLNRSLDYNNTCPLCKDSLSEYLAMRNNTVSELMLFLLREYLGEEYQEREQQHKNEMETMARFVNDQSQCEVPIFVCTLAFPTIPCPLHIFEPRYRLMVRQTMDSGARQFGMCLPDGNIPEGHEDIGCMLDIQHVENLPDGRSVIKTVGGRRFRVLSRGMRDGYNTGLVEFIEDVEVTGDEIAVVQDLERETYKQAKSWFNSLPIVHQTRIIAHFGPTPARDENPLASSQGPSWTWWLLAIVPLNKRIQLAIMALPSLKDRLNALQRCLIRISNFQF